jgi:hypothetical protein
MRTNRAAKNMHATMMHLAIWLPDWNSLDSVRRAHNDLEGVGLVFFALLVVSEALAHLSKAEKRKHGFDTLGIIFFAVAVLAEIAAYPYGQRNDTLSEQIIGSLDAKARDASANATKALTDSGKALVQAGQANIKSGNAVDGADKANTSIEAVGKMASAIDQELQTAQVVLFAPELRDPGGLKKQLVQFKGKSVFFRSYINDGDGYFLCQDLLSVADSAGILGNNQCGQALASPPFMGSVNVFAPDDDTMLSLSGIIGGATPYGSSTGGLGTAPHSPTIVVFVGRRPHVMVGPIATPKSPKITKFLQKNSDKMVPVDPSTSTTRVITIPPKQ